MQTGIGVFTSSVIEVQVWAAPHLSLDFLGLAAKMLVNAVKAKRMVLGEELAS